VVGRWRVEGGTGGGGLGGVRGGGDVGLFCVCGPSKSA
jgi:hypothetical protein